MDKQCENMKANKDYTLEEVRIILDSYLTNQDNPLRVGTQEYYEYLLSILKEDGDEVLARHPQYDLILDYASVYLYEFQNQIQADLGEANKLIDIGDSFAKTIGEVAKCAQIVTEERYIDNSAADQATPPIVWKYDSAKAVAYARKWAKGKNTAYRAFSSDCANFASQCVVAGGVHMVETKHPLTEVTNSTKEWFHIKSGASFCYTTSFVQVAPLASYWILAKAYPTVTVKSLASAIATVKAGDVVNLVHPSTGVHYHSIFVSYKSGSTAKYCGHTSARLDEPFTSLKKDDHYFIIKFAKR